MKARTTERDTAIASENRRAEGLVPAGILSRIGKFAVGAMQIYAVYVLASQPRIAVADEPIDDTGYYVVAALAFFLLPPAVNLGFNRAWGRRPLMVGAGLVAGAMLIDFALYGRAWAPPVAAIIYGVSVYVHGHMGASHVLAAAIGTPGCEMRAIPQIWARLRRRSAAFQPCPGIWTPIDKWEASMRARLSG